MPHDTPPTVALRSATNTHEQATNPLMTPWLHALIPIVIVVILGTIAFLLALGGTFRTGPKENPLPRPGGLPPGTSRRCGPSHAGGQPHHIPGPGPAGARPCADET